MIKAGINKIEAEEFFNHFSRTTENFFTLQDLKKLLESGKQIRIKYGVDVTSPNLHIGHAVNLWMMRYLQELGHKVIFLIGDFTSQIGDPTGKSKLRPIISLKEIKTGEKEFLKQIKLILNTNAKFFEIRHNSEWYGKMRLKDFLSLLAAVTHSHLIARDMFQERIRAGREIYAHELIYPILQGYDSVIIKSDLTIIGSDQLFNEMMGRFFQERFGQNTQVIITTKITPGIDGTEKQSKSLDNYIGLNHSPRDKFGRIMKLPDNLITDYLKIYTNVSLWDIEIARKKYIDDPMAYKMFLAREIVKRYHDEKIAGDEEEWFRSTFQQKEIPFNVPEEKIAAGAYQSLALLTKLKLASSRTEAKRLIEQGGVEINGNVLDDWRGKIEIKRGVIIRVGKRRFVKIK